MPTIQPKYEALTHPSRTPVQVGYADGRCWVRGLADGSVWRAYSAALLTHYSPIAGSAIDRDAMTRDDERLERAPDGSN